VDQHSAYSAHVFRLILKQVRFIDMDRLSVFFLYSVSIIVKTGPVALTCTIIFFASN
jgi:hypothetical protein